MLGPLILDTPIYGPPQFEVLSQRPQVGTLLLPSGLMAANTCAAVLGLHFKLGKDRAQTKRPAAHSDSPHFVTLRLSRGQQSSLIILSGRQATFRKPYCVTAPTFDEPVDLHVVSNRPSSPPNPTGTLWAPIILDPWTGTPAAGRPVSLTLAPWDQIEGLWWRT